MSSNKMKKEFFFAKNVQLPRLREEYLKLFRLKEDCLIDKNFYTEFSNSMTVEYDDVWIEL